jgi:hypothetical protein
MMTAPDQELHTLAGPYALDALADSERARFTAHLADCGQCRDEVRELREATARLGLAAAVRPRPQLREQTIAAAYRTSQLAPFVAKDSYAKSPGDRRRSAAAARRRLLERARATRVPVRIALAAGLALVAAAVALGGVTGSVLGQLQRSQQREHMIAAVLTAPDAVMLTSRVWTGGTATVVMSHREHAAVLTAHGLRPLPSSMGYEIWLMGPSGRRPAGMLRAVAGGMAGPAIVAGLRPGDLIALTVEPAGGSRIPTSVLVVVLRPSGPG